MKKQHLRFLTADERRELIINGEDMPTSIFVAKKEREYIVKPRGTIFGKYRKKRKTKLLS